MTDLAWYVLPEGQLDLLADWLEPALDRPGLARVPKDRLGIRLGSPRAGDVDAIVADAAERLGALESFSVLVGPVRRAGDGFAAGVEPAEELTALRAAVSDEDGAFAPSVTFAHGDGDELEVNASDAMVVVAATLVRSDTWDVVARVALGEGQ